MNSNKKDVNDYFKYLRLYYIALYKKRKKEVKMNTLQFVNYLNHF